MEELIKKAYEDKLKDGTIEKIIEDSINKAVERIMEESVGYNSPFKKAMRAKIEPLLGTIVETSDFNSFIEKLKILFDESVANNAMNKELDSLLKMQSMKYYRYGEKVSSKEIIEAYERFVEEQADIDNDEIEFDEGTGIALVDITCEKVEDDERQSYFGRNDNIFILKARPQNEEEFYNCDLDIEFKIDERGHLKFDAGDIPLNRINTLPAFIIYMYNLSRSYAEIIDQHILNGYTSELEIEIEQE